MAGGARAGVAGADTLKAAASLYERHYRQLVRLSALLTGDRATAETIASDCLLALPQAPGARAGKGELLRYLLRQAVVRSRQARARRALANDSPAGSSGRPDTAEFTGLPVVSALAKLRQPEREAVVLVLYLDLPEQQAAAVLGLGLGKLRRNFAAGAAALQAHLQGQPVTDSAGRA